jgi:hypothetical protein
MALNNLGVVYTSRAEYNDAYWKGEIPLGMFIYILGEGLFFMDGAG